MIVKSCLIFLLVVLALVNGKPVKGKGAKGKGSRKAPAKAPKVATNADALKYLDKFGYNQCGGHASIKPVGTGPLCQSSYKTMIEHFQTIYRLPVTGVLDTATINLMNRPRCSLGDYPLAAYSAFRPW